MQRTLSTPIRIGFLFSVAAILLTIVGILRGNVPLHTSSIAIALLIGGGMWFLVAWAVAALVVHVEEDVQSAAQNGSELSSGEQPKGS